MTKFLAGIFIAATLLSAQHTYAQSSQHSNSGNNKNTPKHPVNAKTILPGAYQTNEYFSLLQGKRVAIFANHTATVGSTHLVDTLQKAGIKISKIFGPEHGFRGNADAGEKVDNFIDQQTGIPVISLYGKKRKPSAEDLADVDVMLFDIQDVGVRFYTFISSLQDYMESAMEHHKQLIILDRPNPNGFYIDGPVLDTTFRSFIGMQPIPVVYGMTIGEYALFLLGEGLLNKNAGSHLDIKVIKCVNYTHQSRYHLKEKPSPNLPDDGSIAWYPSTCFFEGTVLSEGRGTEKPFQIFGHPLLPDTLFAFTPMSTAGAKNPKLLNQKCYGWNLSLPPYRSQANQNQLQLKWLLQAYQMFPDKANFFLKAKKDNLQPTDYFFNKLAGNSMLMQQIIAGKSEQEIRASWQPKLNDFKAKRKKYLLYAD